jgi:hypothetical protein
MSNSPDCAVNTKVSGHCFTSSVANVLLLLLLLLLLLAADLAGAPCTTLPATWEDKRA